MKKKVLVMASTFPRYKNDSTPRFVLDLSKKLNSNYDLIILAPHADLSQKEEILEGIKVRRFAYFKPESMQKLCYEGGIIPNMKKSFLAKLQLPLLIACEFFSAASIIKKEKISAIHAHWMLPQGLVGVFLKKIFNIPLIVTIHGSDLFPLKNKFLVSLQKYVCKNADAITVDTKATKDELVGRFQGFEDKINTIPMGVDLNLFKKKKIKKSSRYSKSKLLLFVGRLSDQKGVQYLIESMPSIIKHDTCVKLLIIGSGPYENHLKSLAKSAKVDDKIEFLGAMTSKEVSEYYNIADIFILPALSNKTGTEALGLSLLEAMACELPVIGTDVGGIRYTIKDEINGVLIEQKNPNSISKAVVDLLKNPSKRKLLSKNASLFVRKNYSWGRISKDFEKLYKMVLK